MGNDDGGKRPTADEPAEAGPTTGPVYPEAGKPLTKEELDYLIDPVAKAALAEHKKEILELLAGGPQNAWKIGEHIGAIVRGKLATRSGYRGGVKSFIRRELRAGRTKILHYSRLHRTFSERDISELGMERLLRLLAYQGLTECPLTPNVADVPIEVPRRDGSTSTVRLADCSKKDLRSAVRYARLSRGRPTSRRLVQFLEAALLEMTRGRVGLTACLGRRQTTIRLSPFALKDAGAVAAALRKTADEIDAQLRANPLLVL